jgi:hypothetical protein
LSEVDPNSVAAGILWAALVDAHLAGENTGQATVAVEELASCARQHPGPYLRATVALARGRLCLAETTGDHR